MGVARDRRRTERRPGPRPQRGFAGTWRMPSCVSSPRTPRRPPRREGADRPASWASPRERDETCRSLLHFPPIRRVWPTRESSPSPPRTTRRRTAGSTRRRRTRRSSWTPSGAPPKHRPPQGRARETETPPHSYTEVQARWMRRSAAPCRPLATFVVRGASPQDEIQRRGSDGLVVVRCRCGMQCRFFELARPQTSVRASRAYL